MSRKPTPEEDNTCNASCSTDTVMLNGPAARRGEIGDTVLVLSYGIYDDSEAGQLEPIIIRVGERNQPMKKD
jgi:aspartate 1-decarboxylase